MSTAPRQRFLVYAPDKSEEGTLEKRLSVRPKHIEGATANFNGGLVRTLNFSPIDPAVGSLADFMINLFLVT